MIDLKQVKPFAEASLQQVYNGILQACSEIALLMRYHKSNKIESQNEFGDI